jgi:hypothetical protein
MSTQVADVLEMALAVFGPHGENWVKMAEGGQGHDMSKKCASLAIGEQPVSQAPIQRAKAILCDVIGIDVMGIYSWNDTPERTWPEVKAAYEKAIAAARRGTE